MRSVLFSTSHLTSPALDFEGSLPAPHDPAVSTLLAPTDASQGYDPSQTQPSQAAAGKRKAYVVNQADVEAVKKVIPLHKCATHSAAILTHPDSLRSVHRRSRYRTGTIPSGSPSAGKRMRVAPFLLVHAFH